MILVKTPLRVSFIGGSTDIENFYSQHPGRCISTTIDQYVYIAINEKFDGDVRVSYSQTEIVPTRKEVKHTRVKAVMERLGVEKGVEIVSISDLPSGGTGLGSSSAFTVGLLNGLAKFDGAWLSSNYLAELACKIEIDVLEEPIGKQDQYSCAYGGLNLINFDKDGVKVEPIILEDRLKQNFQDHLMFFYTEKTRSASTILANQKLNFDVNFKALKKISNMVLMFHEMLKVGNFRDMGFLLDEAWMLKRDLATGITDNEIDRMYETALKNGAWGGKIVGAGGGGFLMLMVEPSKQEAVAIALASYREVKFKFSDKGSEIVYQTT